MTRWLLTASLLLACALHADDWPQFRGKGGSASVEKCDLPDQWSEGNIRWKVPLAGEGISSPCVIGEKIVLTGATDEGRSRTVECRHLTGGELLWSHAEEFETHPKHQKNSFATSTPCGDEAGCCVLLGSTARCRLVSLDWDGKVNWSADLGSFPSRHGPGASPILIGDRVIVPLEPDEPGAVIAVDRASGKEVWRTPRGGSLASYATPLIWKDADGPMVIVSSTAGVTALDPKDGSVVWSEECFDARCVSSPTPNNDLLIAGCGGGGKGTRLVALRTDRTLHESTPRKVWELNRTIPYCPTAVVAGDLAFLLLDNGVARCVAAATGEEVWTKRLFDDVSASPVNLGGRILAVSESGKIALLKASRDFQVLGRFELEDEFLATPAVTDQGLLLRGKSHLWLIVP